MKTILAISLLMICTIANAQNNALRYFESKAHKTNLLELYTSEGCSSCPPAEKWLARMPQPILDKSAVIPLVFHVTYWDYIGWKDKFASQQYDHRQRKMVLQEGGSTVYTPQFFINSRTKRGIHGAISKLMRSEKQPSSIKIKAQITETDEKLHIKVSLKRLLEGLDKVVRVSVAAYENDIRSVIESGENEGLISQHQYVVRGLETALMSLEVARSRPFEFSKKSHKWSGVVIYVESANQVVEALRITL